MIFSEELLSNLPQSPLIAASKLCSEFNDFEKKVKSKARYKAEKNHSVFQGAFASIYVDVSLHDEYIEALGIFMAFCEENDINFKQPEIETDKRNNIQNITTFFTSAGEALSKDVARYTLEKTKSKYASQFSKKFVYEFTQGDLDKIQSIINSLRSEISSSDVFENDHKRRLLLRLEKLQSEMHKKVSDLDQWWGLVGDAGVVLGKLGKDAKPFVDRIKEISEIVWRTQARAEELPSDSPAPMIESDTDSK